MSEYWKSTPKYWCKHCKLYVKDTPLEKKNHESTPRHQGNLKRFLRDLHRSHENEERDKQRAKDEVARLQGLSGGAAPGPGNSSLAYGAGPAPRPQAPQATAADLKRQAAQLLELGIGVPDEFRGELAVPGEWQVTAQRVIEPDGVNMDSERKEARAMGVRKREEVKDEEDEIEKKKVKRTPRYKTYPGAEEDDQDLDKLLSQVMAPKVKVETTEEAKTQAGFTSFKQEPDTSEGEAVRNEAVDCADIKPDPEAATSETKPELALCDVPHIGDDAPAAEADVKREEVVPTGGVVFKKRKAKNIRHK